MPLVSPLELNEAKFLGYLKNFGIADVVIFIVSVIIFELLAKWRPVLNLRYSISHIINSSPYSVEALLVEMVCWAIYLAPYVLTCIIGLKCCIKLSPKIIGVDVMVLVIPSMLFLLCIMNYNRNGYKLSKRSKFTIFACVAAFFGVTIAHAYIAPYTTWRSEAIFASWPSIFLFCLTTILSRDKIDAETTSNILRSEKIKSKFIDNISNSNFETWTNENNYATRIFGTILSLGASAVFNGLFIDKYIGEMKQETLSTAIFSIVFDVIVVLIQFTSFTEVNVVPLMVVVLVLKIINIYLADYWVIAQCIQMLTLGSYFLSKTLGVIFNAAYGEIALINGKEKIDSSVSHAIKHVFGDRASYLGLYNTIASLYGIGMIVLFIVEIYTCDLKEKPAVFVQNGIEFSQYTFVISTLLVSCFFAVVLAMRKVDADYGEPHIIRGIFPIFLLCLIFILLMVFNLALDAKCYDLGYYIPSVFGLISTVVLMNRTFRLSHITNFRKNFNEMFGLFWVYTLNILITFTLFILLIVLPFTGETGYRGIFVLSVVIVLMCTYIIFMQKKNKDFAVVQLTCYIIAAIFSIASIVFSFFIFDSWKNVLLIDACAAFGICLIFAYSDMRNNKFKMSTKALMFICIPGIALFIIGLVMVFFDRELFGTIVSLIGGFGFGAALTVYYMKEKMLGLRLAGPASLVVLQLASLIVYWVIIHEALQCVTMFFFYVYFAFLLYLLYALTLKNEMHTFVFSEIMVPVHIYHNGKMERVPFVGICIVYLFFMPLFGGAILTTFTTNAEISFIVQGIAFIVPILIAAYHMNPFESKALGALDFVRKQTIAYDIKQAMIASSTDFHDNPGQDAFYTYDEFVLFVDNKTNISTQKVLFIQALKGQLNISYQVHCKTILNTIRQYIHERKASWDYVDIPHEYTMDNMFELADVYSAIETLRKQSRKAQEDIIAKMKSQEELRHRYHVSAASHSPELASYYNDAVNYLHNSNTKYEDPQFVPQAEPEREDDVMLSAVTWQRAETQFTGPFIGSKFDPQEVRMGDLDDSYLVSAMISLAKNPENVQTLFQQPLQIQKSIFEVLFKSCGQKLVSIVDSKLPFQGSLPKFISPISAGTSSWWYSIVEKAFAKASGGFSNIQGGFCHQALSMLVDGIPKCIDLQSDEGHELVGCNALWNDVVRILDEGGHVCAAKLQPDDSNKGSYAILHAVEAHGFQLINLRNPYGISEWFGDWSKDSILWTKYPDVKAACTRAINDDSTFWMPFNAFADSFKFIYTLDIQWDSYLYEIRSSFVLNNNDGADPYLETEPTLDKVPNILIRFTKATKLRCVLERMGAETPVKAYLVYNYGKPIKRILLGRDSRFGECQSDKTFHAFEWDVTKVDKPWTLAVTRKCHDHESKYCLRIWSDSPLEVSQIPVHEDPNDEYAVPLQNVTIKEYSPNP